jgi:hypothetical protein
MTKIRPARAADALRLAGPLAQLGYLGELDAVTSRLAGILKSAVQRILVAGPPDDSRIDGYIGLERRLTLHQDEHVKITDMVVGAARRPAGPASAGPWSRPAKSGQHSTACTPWWSGPTSCAPNPACSTTESGTSGRLAHLPQAGLGHACSICRCSEARPGDPEAAGAVDGARLITIATRLRQPRRRQP